VFTTAKARLQARTFSCQPHPPPARAEVRISGFTFPIPPTVCTDSGLYAERTLFNRFINFRLFGPKAYKIMLVPKLFTQRACKPTWYTSGKPGEFSKQPGCCQATANADGGSKASSVPATALFCVRTVAILPFFACTAGLCVCLSLSLTN